MGPNPILYSYEEPLLMAGCILMALVMSRSMHVFLRVAREEACIREKSELGRTWADRSLRQSYFHSK